jgi:hypothetical protein
MYDWVVPMFWKVVRFLALVAAIVFSLLCWFAFFSVFGG